MIIYKTTNLINNKIYIGKDEKNDPKYLGSGLLIKRAINKYGEEHFSKVILEECTTREELNEKEKLWIEKYNSRDVSIGYNITIGGEGGLTSSIEKLSKISKELWLNPEYVEKQKEGRKNRIYRQKGEYTHSDETKEKLKVIHTGKKQSDEHKEKTKKNNLEKRIYTIIKCVETGQIFKSINEAKRWLGKGDIQSCLNGRQKMAGGYHWERLTDLKSRK